MTTTFGETMAAGIGIAPVSASRASEVWSVVDAAFARYAPRMDGPPAPLLADYTKLCDRGGVVALRVGRRIAAVLVSDVVGDTLQIETMAVHPAFEGQGHGTTMLEWAIDEVLPHGVTAVTLYTNVVMHEARAFWEANGFSMTGHRVEDGYDRLYFRRSLLPEGARV